jgi:hypothetical protein
MKKLIRPPRLLKPRPMRFKKAGGAGAQSADTADTGAGEPRNNLASQAVSYDRRSMNASTSAPDPPLCDSQYYTPCRSEAKPR